MRAAGGFWPCKSNVGQRRDECQLPQRHREFAPPTDEAPVGGTRRQVDGPQATRPLTIYLPRIIRHSSVVSFRNDECPCLRTMPNLPRYASFARVAGNRNRL